MLEEPEICTDIKVGTERLGDRFYRAMTDWVIDGARSREKNENAYRLARIYYRALDLLLFCLRKLRRTPKVQSKIEQTVDYKQILKQDIELLNSRKGQLPTSSEG